jgi:hypothetical protein
MQKECGARSREDAVWWRGKRKKRRWREGTSESERY